MKSFKDPFFLLRSLFLTFVRSIGRSSKNPRFKLILFSNFYKKSFSIIFSKRHVVIAFVGVLFFSTMAFYFFRGLTEQKIKLKQRQALNKTYEKRIEDLHGYGNSIVGYNEKYEREIEEIFSHLGQVSANKLWGGKMSGINFENEGSAGVLDSIKNYWRSTKGYALRQLGINLEIERAQLDILAEKSDRTRATLQHLQEIETFFSLKSELRQHVPTGWPLIAKVGYKTSGYGPRFSPFTEKVEFHTGVDIGAAPGTKIVATADGVVAFSGSKTGYGDVITLRHKYGHTSSYAHNQELLVETGQRVKKGQPIAHLGNSGRSTGYHLHYETVLNGQYVDPWPYLVSEF